jgi:uncharacterized coiled-coil DUF342 family protein
MPEIVIQLWKKFLLDTRVLRRAKIGSALLLFVGFCVGGSLMYLWDKTSLDIADRNARLWESQYATLKDKRLEAGDGEAGDSEPRTAVFAEDPPKHLSPKDKDNIADAMAEFSTFLNTEVLTLKAEGDAVIKNWSQTRDPRSTIAGLNSYQAHIQRIYQPFRDLRDKKYRLYADELTPILAINQEPQLSKALTRSMDFEQKLESVQKIVATNPNLKEQVAALVQPVDSFFAHANSDLALWVTNFNIHAQRAKKTLLQGAN